MERDPVLALAEDPEIKPLLDRTYLKVVQRREMEGEIAELEFKLTDPFFKRQLSNPGALAQQLRDRKKLLEMQTPPPLTPSQAEKLNRLEQASGDAIRRGMRATKDDLRHAKLNSPVSQQIRQEEKTTKVHRLLWKKTRMLLDPTNDDPFLTNHEHHFRPEGLKDTIGRDDRINRLWTLSAEAKERFQEIEWGPEETQEQFVERLQRELGIKVTFKARPLREFGDGGPVLECQTHERIFSGPLAKLHHGRHMKSKEHQQSA